MSRKSWYRIHKWIAIVLGVFLLGWTVSGIVMVLPPFWFGLTEVNAEQPISYRDAVLSPAEAITSLEQALGEPVQVKSFGLLKLHGRLVYQISIPGDLRLVDSQTGELVELDANLAGQIVRDSLPEKNGDDRVDLVTSHSAIYPFGPLPVYRVTFPDDADSYYVNVWNGRVSRSNAMTRLRRAIVSVHTFEPIRLLVHREALQNGALILFSLVGIATALTGYYLAILPLTKRKSNNRGDDE